jgi:hypothetical protein
MDISYLNPKNFVELKGYCQAWQPIAQEKPMEKIQMTEEQARELFSVIGLVETIDMAIDESKKHGYIRKSAVEEAEEMYQEWLYAIEATRSPINKNNLNVKLYEAIQELKKEIARLKK